MEQTLSLKRLGSMLLGAAALGLALVATSGTASASTKVNSYQNIKDATYTITNKKAAVYSTAKLTHKKSTAKSYPTKVTAYYAAHVTKNGKKSVYYKFKTSTKKTGWIWHGYLRKSSTVKWTKGTPAALRGKWYAKKDFVGPSPVDGQTIPVQQWAEIYKKDLEFEALQIYNPMTLTKTYYHHAKGSQYYYIKGDNGSIIYDKFQLSGNKLRFKTYLTLNKKTQKPTKMDYSCSSQYTEWLYKNEPARR